MKIVDLKKLSLEFSNNLKLNYNLKNKNWFNIGGKTKIYYKADTLKELIKFLKIIYNKEIISDYPLPYDKKKSRYDFYL